MDVLVKEGSLFLQGVKFGKKIWRKIWAMVFKPSQAGIGRIEMYDIREGAGMSAKLAILKKSEKRVIRLADCLSVTPALGESCPAGCTAFYLNTAQRTYTLAAPAQDEWVSDLCSLAFQGNEAGGEAKSTPGDCRDVDAPMTENDIYSTLSPGKFQVTVASSEASVRCCMSGPYLLAPEKESLCLINMKTGHVAFFWPYRCLRRFGLVKEGITIEAGRRCQTGEGLFLFLSKQGPQIYRAIEEAIMHQSVQDLLSQATALSQENTVPPPVPKVPSPVPKVPPPVPKVPSPVPKFPAPVPKFPAPVPKVPLPVPKVPSLMPKAPSPVPKVPSPVPKVPSPLPKGQSPLPKVPPPVQTVPPPVQTVSPPSPKMDISRRNLALPALPGTKPPIKIPEPECDQAVYAKIKPHPKPRNIPVPPPLPTSKPMPNPEIKPDDLDTSDKDPDYESCNWNQKVEPIKETPDTQLYSVIRPPPNGRRKPDLDTNQENPKSSRTSPIPISFRQMLSDVLFRDSSKVGPPPPPKPYADNTDFLAEPDYYEIKK